MPKFFSPKLKIKITKQNLQNKMSLKIFVAREVFVPS
jgi:hypothetical protein